MADLRQIRRNLVDLLPERVAVQAFEWRGIARATLPNARWPRDLRRGIAAVSLWERLRRYRLEGEALGRIPLASLRADLELGPAVAQPAPLGWVFGVREHDQPASLRMRSGSRAVFHLELDRQTRFECRLQSDTGSAVDFAVGLRTASGAVWRHAKTLGGAGQGTIAALSVPLPVTGGEPLTLELSLEGDDPAAIGLWIDPCLSSAPAPAPAKPQEPMPTSLPARAHGGLPTRGTSPPSPNPRLSFLTPVHDPNPVFLDRAITSVQRQTVADWELCLFDDASTDDEVRELLAAHAEADPRISLLRSETGLGIAGATNAALEMANGEFVLLLDHDDELDPDAVAAIQAALAEYPSADATYTDEATIDRSNRWLGNFLKPAWSPEFFESNMYSCHLGAYRRSLVEELGGLRSECDGSQDYDLLLRISERSDRIVHTPGVRYFWRFHERSASAGAKPYAYRAAERALTEHLERVGRPGKVEAMALPGAYHREPLERTASITAVVAVQVGDDAEALAGCLAELDRVGDAQLEIVCAASGPESGRLARDAGAALACAFEVRQGPGDATRAELLDLAAAATRSELVLFVRGPFSGANKAWLDELATVIASPGLGAVGALEISPDDRVEHAGVAIADGLPLICDLDEPLAFDQPERVRATQTCVRNVSATSGTILVERQLIDAIGGLADGGFDQLAELDFCLRARSRGQRIAVTPHARLRRLGAPPTRDPTDLVELLRFQRRWYSTETDPYYHPSFCGQRGYFWGTATPEPQPSWRPPSVGDGPAADDQVPPGLREELAAVFLHGHGIEIGPLHSPLRVPSGVVVRYVDRMPVTLLRRHYPELARLPLVEIDVMDDGERLATVQSESQDFVIANHLLEHTGDPISTVGNWLRVLRPGGVIFLAVPDKRYTFDIEREPTPIEHMIRDHEQGPDTSRRQHFEEWARHVERVSEDRVAERAEILEQIDYSVHTHVFTERELLELIFACDERVGPIEVEALRRNGLETLVVIRKPDPGVELPQPPRAYDELPMPG